MRIIKILINGVILLLVPFSETAAIGRAVDNVVGSARISGYADGLAGDTLILTYWENALNDIRYNKIFPRIDQDLVLDSAGKFSVILPFKRSAQYFTLRSKKRKEVWKDDLYHRSGGGLLDFSRFTSDAQVDLDPFDFILEPGDDVRLMLYPDSLTISGKGAAKLTCLYEIAQSKRAPERFQILHDGKDTTLLRKFIDYLAIRQQFTLDVLESYKGRMSPLSYEIIKADLVGKILRTYYGSFDRKLDPRKYPNMFELYKAHLVGHPLFQDLQLTSEGKGLSKYFASFVKIKLYYDVMCQHWTIDPKVDHDRSRIIRHNFDFTLQNYSGPLADKLLLMYCHDAQRFEDNDYFLTKAIAVMRVPSLRDVALWYWEETRKGVTAYNFSVENVSGDTVRLEHFRGKVVLVDMWDSGCSACVFVATAMRTTVEPRFANNPDVVFISLSLDRDQYREVWEKGIKKGGRYYSGDKSIYLRTLGGSKNKFVQKYLLGGVPQLMLIDREGKIYALNAHRPINGKEQLLIDQINEALTSSGENSSVSL